jgi:methyltransferase (TIGR00027 family)
MPPVPWRAMRTLRQHDRPSRTAQAVAAGRAIGYRHLHDPLVIDMLPLVERSLVRRVRPVAARRIGADAIAAATGGLSRHAALRMAAVDAALAAALSDGCQQVVVVGAGLDTRAWRLPALAGTPVWEIDLPATQAAKHDGIRAAGLDPGRAVLVPADLAGRDLPDVLGGTDHDPAAPTAWIWEAVAPYLPPDAVAATLGGMRALSAAGSRLVMTYARPDMLGPGPVTPLTGALALLAFRVVGEPLLSTHDEWDIAHLLTQHGFGSPSTTGVRDWADAVGLPGRPDPAASERLATALAD